MVKLIFVFTSLLLTIPCQARIITVDDDGPADFNNIQAAINDANDYDEIEVDPGTYYEAINFKGKAVRLYSSGGPHVTTIDGTGLSYIVTCMSGEEANTILEGFTITGGTTCPEPSECGVAMLNSSSSPTVINCTFSNNRGYGGAMYNYQSSSTLINCTFIGNMADDGGGMHNYESSPSVINCTFSDNIGMFRGGGMYNQNNSNPTVTNCTFTGNRAESGGGMGDSNSSPTVINCTFSNNRGVMFGGGIDNAVSSKPTVINCTFTGNRAMWGGGMYNGNSSPTVTNCTFTGNTVDSACGGMYNYKSSPNVTNCILWDNMLDEIVDNQSSSTFSYSDIQGGWPGPGNIDADPCFADSTNGDYHLKSQAGRWDPNSQTWVQDDVNSPCIDTGDPTSDWTAELWPHGKRINMGAYGGTPEASMSQLDIGYIANLDNDVNDIVNSLDLALFVGKWCYEEFLLAEDLNRDGFVNFNDFALFGQQWSYPSASEPSMTFQIDDCNMEDGLNWTVAEEPNQPRFSVWVEGSYIHFEDLITANCCADEIELQMTVEDGLITIYEIEHLIGIPCPCICDYPVTATLGPFDDGNYMVEVIGINGSSLGAVEVTIGEETRPGITYQIEDCDQDAFGEFTAEPPDLTRFKITVEGQYIHFEDMMYANCCPDELELEMTVENNLITIYETEYTLEGCRCMCSFPITATLGPFEPGIYTLEVYETMGGFIGSTNITIDPDQ